MELKGYIVGTSFYMDEYGRIVTMSNGSYTVAYYGPKVKDKHVIEALVAQELNLPSLITVSGTYERGSEKVGSVSIASELYDYEISERKNIGLLIEWTGDKFVIHRGRGRFDELLEEIETAKEKAKTKEQIDAFNSLTEAQKINYVKEIMGRNK